MRPILIDELKEKVLESTDFSCLCIKLGFIPSTNTKNRLKRLIQENCISILHFDRYSKNKSRRIHKIIDKTCPVCLSNFSTLNSNDKREKEYCSYKCSNSLHLGERHSKQTHQKISLSKKDLTIKKRICKQCNSEFILKNRLNQTFCTQSCAAKAMWKSDLSRKKIISSLKERIKNGLHKGWATRNILSYPERFFKKVLDRNGLYGKYKINFPITKKSLGINSISCYFLDFYFEDWKIDLEIDGQQHKREDRANSDKIRDEILSKNGIKVYRIEWKHIGNNKEYFKYEISKLLDFLWSLSSNEERNPDKVEVPVS